MKFRKIFSEHTLTKLVNSTQQQQERKKKHLRQQLQVLLCETGYLTYVALTAFCICGELRTCSKCIISSDYDIKRQMIYRI